MKTHDGVEVRVGMKVVPTADAIKRALVALMSSSPMFKSVRTWNDLLAMAEKKEHGGGAKMEAQVQEQAVEAQKTPQIVASLQPPSKFTVTQESAPGSTIHVTSSATVDADDYVTYPAVASPELVELVPPSSSFFVKVRWGRPTWQWGIGAAAVAGLVVWWRRK